MASALVHGINLSSQADYTSIGNDRVPIQRLGRLCGNSSTLDRAAHVTTGQPAG